MRIKQLILTVFATLMVGVANAQMYGLHTNTLGDITGNFNIGIEFKVNQNMSIDFPVYYNPFKFKKFAMMNATIQPAIKYWFQNTFVGSYISVSNTTSYFQIGRNNRLNTGWLSGGGVGFGYSWILSKSLSFGIEAGAGIYYTKYTDEPRNTHYTEDRFVYDHRRVLLLPSRLQCNLIYHF